MAKNKNLESRVEELESLLEKKDDEIKLFKQEMTSLNEQIEDLIEKLTKQVNVALSLQKKLVPTEFPNIPGFEFSTKFQGSMESGGDYFDIFEIEDRFRFSILLSSCSGYSISSLFLSVLLKMTSQIETKKGAPVEKVVGLLFKELLPQMTEKDSANIFYALINRRNFQIDYCHYGNNLIYYYNSQEKKLIEIPAQGEALSSKLKGKIQSESLSLNPRDILIMITDGIFRVQNNKGQGLEKSKIHKLILDKIEGSAHELRNEIFFQVQRFQSKKELPKDLTVVVAEVKDKVLKLAKS